MNKIIVLILLFTCKVLLAESLEVLDVTGFENGIAVFKNKQNKFGLVDVDGNILTKTKFSHLELLDKNQSLYKGIQNVLGKDRYMLLDKQGNQLGKMQYDYLEKAVDSEGKFQNLLKVQLGGFWGFIDTKGKKFTPLKYGHIIYDDIDDVSISFAYNTGVQGVVKSSKEVLNIKDYYLASDFNDLGLAVVHRGSRKGVINTKGELIVPVSYNDIQFFENGLIGVQSTTQKAKKCDYPAYKKYLWGVYTVDGKTFVKPKYSRLFQSYYLSDKLMSASICDDNKDTKSGYLDTNAKEIIPIKYDINFGIGNFIKLGVYDPPNPTVFGRKTPSKDIYLNENMEELKIEDNYYDIHFVYGTDDFFQLENDKGVAIFDKQGKMIISTGKYRKINYKDKFFYVEDKSGRSGVLDIEGKVIVPAKYIQIEKLKSPFFMVAQRAGTGRGVVSDLIDLNGKPLGMTQFNEFEALNEKFTAMKDEHNLWGVIDKNGKIAITPRFKKKPRFFNDNLFITVIKNPVRRKATKNHMLAPKDEFVGVIDINGREVVPFDKSLIQEKNKNTLTAIQFMYDREFPLGHMFIKIKDKKVAFASEPYFNLTSLSDDLFAFCELNAEAKKCPFGVMSSDGEVILEAKYEVKNREFPVTYLGDGMLKVFNKTTDSFFVFNTKTKKTIMEIQDEHEM